MKSEIIEKITKIISRSSLEEAHVQHLFVLTRKLIEKFSENNRKDFSLLKFYCDWSLHSRIDKSEVGANILKKINGTLFFYLENGSKKSITHDLNEVLSLSRARDELNKLIQESGGSSNVVSKKKWAEIIIIFAEIISQCPLKIMEGKRFNSLIGKMGNHLIKDSIVESLSIMNLSKKDGEFNIVIRIGDSITFSVPLMK